MSIVKSIIYEKPNSLKLLVSFMLFVGLFAVMSLIPFLPDTFRIVGLIMSGIIIGFSFALTRNVIVPLLIIVGYNSIVSTLRISVIPYSSIDIEHLYTKMTAYDSLAARQCVVDAARGGLEWRRVPAPEDLDPVGMAVAAGVTELLASRAGQSPPAWTAEVSAAPEPVFLVRAAAKLPRLRRSCEQEGPEPLRRRGVLAPPEFLTSA